MESVFAGKRRIERGREVAARNACETALGEGVPRRVVANKLAADFDDPFPFGEREAGREIRRNIVTLLAFHDDRAPVRQGIDYAPHCKRRPRLEMQRKHEPSARQPRIPVAVVRRGEVACRESCVAERIEHRLAPRARLAEEDHVNVLVRAMAHAREFGRVTSFYHPHTCTGYLAADHLRIARTVVPDGKALCERSQRLKVVRPLANRLRVVDDGRRRQSRRNRGLEKVRADDDVGAIAKKTIGVGRRRPK